MNKLIASLSTVSLLMILCVSNVAAGVYNPTYPVRVIDPAGLGRARGVRKRRVCQCLR